MDEPELRPPTSLRDLFRVFNRLSMQGFGGVLPVAQFHIVDRERWLTKEQFVELLSIGQILPGPNVVNLSLMIGDRFFGWRGALVSLLGMMLLPTGIVLALAALYTQFESLPAVAGALRGMGAVAAGLVIATSLKMMPTLSRNPMGRGACALAVLLAAVAIGGFRWPLVWVLAGLGSLSVAHAWRVLGRAPAR